MDGSTFLKVWLFYQFEMHRCLDATSNKVFSPNLTNSTPVVETEPWMLVATHWKYPVSVVSRLRMRRRDPNSVDL